MDNSIPALPPGFTLDEDHPPLPPGFTLDAAPRPASVVRDEYNAMPWYKKPLQAADDVVRLGLDGLTAGYGDKLAGYLSGNGAPAERALTQEARDRAGSAGLASEIVGGVAGSGKLKLGATAAEALAPQLLKSVAGRMGVGAAEGAAYGAANATGHDRPDVGLEAGFGGLAGAAGSALADAVGAAGRKVLGVFNKKPVIPTEDAVRQAAQAAYAKADGAGIVYTPQAVDALKQRVTSELAGMGYDPALQPGAAAVLRRLEDLSGGNVTLTGLDTLRKVASNGFLPGNRSNNLAVSKLMSAIDDAVSSPQAGHVLMGNAQEGADALGEARSLWARLAKADSVRAAEGSGELRASATGAGGNVDNAIRQNMRSVYEKGRGFSPDEQDALLTAIQGSPGQNILRIAGKFAPTSPFNLGVGGMAGSSLGSFFGPTGSVIGGFAVPVLGQVARTTSENMTKGHVEDLVKLIMAGGDKSALAVAPNIGQRFLQSNAENMARVLPSAVRAEQNRGPQ